MTAVMISGALAMLTFAIGRWGLRNADALVPARATAELRRKEERALRRGAWLCLAMALLFTALAVVAAMGAIADASTTR